MNTGNSARGQKNTPAGPRRVRKLHRGGPGVAYALFLDFDGVLHPTAVEGASVAEAGPVVATTLFGWLPLLVAQLKPYPQVAVVVSSTWRYTHNLEELRDVLGELGPRVVGATPRGPRYESIQGWLALNPMCLSHRILDDALSEFPNPAPPELILCNPREGVSSATVQAALQSWLDGRE